MKERTIYTCEVCRARRYKKANISRDCVKNFQLTGTQWRYSPTGLWPTERPPPVSEASANFLRIEGCHVVSATDPYGR